VKAIRITDLDASLPLEVHTPYVDMIVLGSDVRLCRFADEFTSVKNSIARLLQGTNTLSDAPQSPVTLTSGAGGRGTAGGMREGDVGGRITHVRGGCLTVTCIRYLTDNTNPMSELQLTIRNRVATLQYIH